MDIKRRGLIGGTAAVGIVAQLPLPALAQATHVALVTSPSDPIAASGPVQWAMGELRAALRARGMATDVVASLADAPAGSKAVVLAGMASPLAQRISREAGTSLPEGAETVALVGATVDERTALLAAGGDDLGLVYAITELADRVRTATAGDQGLSIGNAILERPANRVRSVARLVSSEIEDRGWLHDQTMWREYLTMLVSNRFNHFSLTLGIQYDFPMEVSDSYFYFAYPFLLKVPGYDVAARGLPNDERDRNLDTLRFIARETVRRGLTFRLGLWTHGYKFDSPRANYRVDGITPQNHANYCRDALALLLTSVPDIGALTIRLHGESGIPEGDLTFWRTVFQAISGAGRKIAIDLHPKGIDQSSIDMALSTNMPISISPKYMGEHMGLPYHESAIRSVDMPPVGGASDARFALSEGTRKYTRYSYGDFLVEDRKYDVVFRLWPGTQRVLLWGDPVFAAGFGRHASFCGAGGLEIMEPLSFRGRKGSGRPGDRGGYADASLAPAYDWQKYATTYRLFGRLTYNPETSPEVWLRDMTATYGAAAAPEIETALSNASRILPLLTMAHGVAAANNYFWPEIPTNMSVVQEDTGRPFTDTVRPSRFATIESFDPRMFASIADFARNLLAGVAEPRMTPVEAAAQLDVFAQRAEAALARTGAHNATAVALRRLAGDVSIVAAVGRFFANKLRAGVLWEIHQLSGDQASANAALEAYRAARAAWLVAIAAAAPYAEDITFGQEAWLRGHWRDRLPAIDADIAEMQRLVSDTNGGGNGAGGDASFAIAQVVSAPSGRDSSGEHAPPDLFRRGAAIALVIAAPGVEAARLHYRHVNQADAWKTEEMNLADGSWRAIIPGGYTDSPFPIQYYFELRRAGSASIFPGLAPDLANQPYFVVRQANRAA